MADVFCLCDTRNPSRGRFADRINRFAERVVDEEYEDAISS